MELFGVSATESVLDEAIIPRCAREGRVWITADERAQRQHEMALKQHLVSVLWVNRPRGGMSTAYQHAHLAAALLHLDYEFTSRGDHALHYRLGPTLHAKPTELWRSRRPRETDRA